METRIVWLTDPLGFPFLREWGGDVVARAFRRRTGLPTPKEWVLTFKELVYSGENERLLVGYAEVDDYPVFPTIGYYKRRVWVIKRYDLEPGGCPAEAVVPSSIRLNQPSIKYIGGTD